MTYVRIYQNNGCAEANFGGINIAYAQLACPGRIKGDLCMVKRPAQAKNTRGMAHRAHHSVLGS